MRLSVSTRKTVAPRLARSFEIKGPAAIQEKSATLRPSKACVRGVGEETVGASGLRSRESTSAWSWPRVGAGRSYSIGVPESRAKGPGCFSPSTSIQKSRARSWGSARRSGARLMGEINHFCLTASVWISAFVIECILALNWEIARSAVSSDSVPSWSCWIQVIQSISIRSASSSPCSPIQFMQALNPKAP